MFMSPLQPQAGGPFVNMALVDTGSSDCELRESYLKQLGPLPTVAAGVVYETVAGRHVFDSYEVLVKVNDRVAAVAVTGIPEDPSYPKLSQVHLAFGSWDKDNGSELLRAFLLLSRVGMFGPVPVFNA